jgi:signal transduction histidine kinase
LAGVVSAIAGGGRIGHGQIRSAHTLPEKSRRDELHGGASQRFNGYLVAFLATVLLLVLRLALDRFLALTSPFLFFAPAVMVGAWYGGRGPGLLATVVGAIAANYFLLLPTGRFSNAPEDITKTVIFLVVGGQISWLSGALHAAIRRAESDAEAARRGEQLYRTLAQNFPKGAVFLLDTGLNVVLAEGEAIDTAGMSAARVRGARLARAFPRQVLAALAPLIRSESGGTTEIAFGKRVYLVQVVPLRGTAGRRFAGMGIAQDITELATARSALQAAHDELEVRVAERTAELQFQTALLEAQSNASLDGILVASDDGRIIFHNRRLSQIWGLPQRAFAGTRDAAVMAMRSVLAGKQDPLGGGADVDAPRVELPANLDLRDGRTLDCYGAPVASADGQSYGRVWYFRDVTERRQTARQILEAGERERQRIGQDLHDDLCQQLAGITCLGRVLHQRLLARLPEEAANAAQVVDLVEQSVHRARDIARGLQPLQLETDGLAVALQGLAMSIQQMFQVRCHVACEQSITISDPASIIQLYRITQEAISNAIRHGQAGNIYIDLTHVGERTILTIEDDGTGIDPADSSLGLGVRTMQHRARLIGAALTIEAADAGGTVVTCTVDTRPGAAMAPAKEDRDAAP